MEPDPDEHVHPGLESLQWGSDTLQGVAPSAKYNVLSEQARRMVSSESQCAMFCGGKKCKYCTYSQWDDIQMAINGIYSNWVTDKILAMARPTKKAIKEKKILDKFEENDIKAVINLQMPGEHSACGEGLDKSGFSYDPQQLMERGIFFYNFGWNDYGVASLSTILDIAKVMQFALSDGKIAVHCHAGLGRTGLMIACYLVFTNRVKAGDAVQYVRSRRPKSIQTSEQVRTVTEFEEYLKPFRVIYASKDQSCHEFSLRQFLTRQRHILHGFEGKKLKFLPKIIYVCCERLLELTDKGNSLHKTRSTLSISDVQSDILRNTVLSRSSSNNGSQVTLRSDDHLLDPEPLSVSQRSKSFEDLRNTDFRTVLEHRGVTVDGNGRKTTDSESHDTSEEDDDDDIVIGNSNIQCNGKTCAEARKKESAKFDAAPDTLSLQESIRTLDSELDRTSLSSLLRTSSAQSAPSIVDALIETDYNVIVLKRTSDFEEALNQTDEAWSVIAQEEDPVVICLLMWDWFDQLSEPVLSAQDLATLLNSGSEPPEVVLFKVEKGLKSLLEYLCRVMLKLYPMSRDREQSLFERMLSHLCHQVVREEVLSRPVPETMDDWPKMRPSSAKQLIRFFLKLIRYLNKKG